MRWVRLPGVRNRILTAATIGGLVAISVLTAPAPAFADPADCAIDPTKLSCETNESNIPTSPDDTRCVQMPLAVGCEGGPWDGDQ
jgi:hypothetical protein